MLRPDHTIDAHFDLIGIDLSKNASFFSLLKNINSYHAKLDSDTVHMLVRYNPGVKLVQHNSFMGGFERTNLTSLDNTRRDLEEYVTWPQTEDDRRIYWRDFTYIL